MTNIELHSQATSWCRILWAWFLSIIQEESSKPWKCIHNKTTENLYVKKSHKHDTHQRQKLRYYSWFQTNDYIKYLHDIFTQVPKPLTGSTKNIDHVYKLFFGNTVLKQHQNHYYTLIKLVNNYQKIATNRIEKHSLELMKITWCHKQ